MNAMDKAAIERINDLQEQVTDLHVLHDLDQETIAELRAEIARLRQAMQEFKLYHRTDLVA